MAEEAAVASLDRVVWGGHPRKVTSEKGLGGSDGVWCVGIRASGKGQHIALRTQVCLAVQRTVGS